MEEENSTKKWANINFMVPESVHVILKSRAIVEGKHYKDFLNEILSKAAQQYGGVE